MLNMKHDIEHVKQLFHMYLKVICSVDDEFGSILLQFTLFPDNYCTFVVYTYDN